MLGEHTRISQSRTRNQYGYLNICTSNFVDRLEAHPRSMQVRDLGYR